MPANHDLFRKIFQGKTSKAVIHIAQEIAESFAVSVSSLIFVALTLQSHLGKMTCKY